MTIINSQGYIFFLGGHMYIKAPALLTVTTAAVLLVRVLLVQGMSGVCALRAFSKRVLACSVWGQAGKPFGKQEI